MASDTEKEFTPAVIEKMAIDLKESGKYHCDPGLTYLASRLRKLKEQLAS